MMDAASSLARWLVFPGRFAEPGVIQADVPVAAAAAEANGLLPLWHVRARQNGLAMPAEIAPAAAAEYYASLARANHYAHELSVVQAAAGNLAVPLVVLKGMHLATALYPHVAARPVVDLDLLTPRAGVGRLIAALAPAGLTELERDAWPGHAREYEIQTLLVRHGARLYSRVALHWDLFDYPFYEGKFPITDVCARARTQAIGAVAAHVMCDEDLLVYLSAHAALHHRFSRLLWLCDIALLLDARGSRIDWDCVLSLIRASELSLPCLAALDRVNAIFGVGVPADARRSLAGQPVSAAAQAAWAELGSSERGAGRRFLGDWRAMHGVRRRLSFAVSQLLPDPAYMRRRYGVQHARDLPQAYVRRWLRGLASLGRGSARQ